MQVSVDWLKEFLDFPKNVATDDIAQRLTLATTEIEGSFTYEDLLENVVIGKVESMKAHPNADKLNICMVSDGKKSYQVICGAPNVKEGMLGAFAKVGARVKWHGEGELVTLEKAKIRGEESHGMLCGADEIALSNRPSDGIVDLTHTKAKPGTPLVKALHLEGVILEVDNKSITHRPDLWGHYGLARECAALYQVPLKPYDAPEVKTEKDTSVSLDIVVHEKDLCPRYSGIIIDHVKIEPSPQFIQSRLIACGMRPINNIVDITNYVMLELGQPLHAFDVHQIAQGNTPVIVHVRRAKKNEVFTALDQTNYELSKEHLVIANEEGPIALAGIKGGYASGITENTTRILLESANFDPVSVRKTSTDVALRSDASSRYEKSLDPNLVPIALKRACELFKEHVPGVKFLNDIVDVNHAKQKEIVLKTSVKEINKTIGMEISQEEIVRILESLEFGVKQDAQKLAVSVPSFRSTKDVLHSYDLVEEVTRIYGYNRITEKLPLMQMQATLRDPLSQLTDVVKDELACLGYQEVYNYSFVSEKVMELYKGDAAQHIAIENPFSSDVTHLRKNLLVGLLQNVADNFREESELHFFEVGRLYLPEEMSQDIISMDTKKTLPSQPMYLGIMIAKKDAKSTFYELKGSVERILDVLNVPYTITQRTEPLVWGKQGAMADVHVHGQYVGNISRVHERIAKKLGITHGVYMAQLDMSMLVSHQAPIQYHAPSKYPSMKLDMAIVVDREILWEDIIQEIRKEKTDLITDITVFDVYEGKQIPEGKKSIAFHITYQSHEKTLTMQEAEALQKKVLSRLEKAFKAHLRS